jgi:ubiquinone/menaquinone biosynthesis C-methylase UbiE
MEEMKCSIEECDIFDFMANIVGMVVLHPGGFEATNRLAQLCHINRDTRVLDIACGKGTSAVYLAKKWGCKVEGIDIDKNLIKQARNLAKRKGLEKRVSFQVGNALELPSQDDEFDVSISQAILVLLLDKKKAISESLRITKPGGYVGWIELSLKKDPTQKFLDLAAAKGCAYCIQNALTFDDWKELFLKCGVKDLKVVEGVMGRHRMLKDEGFLNTFRIMSKWLFNARIRKRMNAIFNFFSNNSEYIGYGIYVGRK